MHGPYFYTRLKAGDGYVTRYLGRDAKRIGLARAFREYVSTMARYRELQREIDRCFIALRDLGIVPWKEGVRNGAKRR